MMIHAAINILILSVLLLIVGLWKPKILLFWLDEPKRFPIIVMFLLLVMVGVTLFGEGTRQKQLEEESLQAKKNTIEKVTTFETLKDIPDLIENKPPLDTIKISPDAAKKPSSATKIITTSTP
jgi:hypothetical protein